MAPAFSPEPQSSHLYISSISHEKLRVLFIGPTSILALSTAQVVDSPGVQPNLQLPSEMPLSETRIH